MADHLVAQLYQRRWANADGQILLYDRTTGRNNTPSLKNAIAENGFYTVRMEDGTESTAIEEIISQAWEGGAASVFRSLDDGTWPLAPEDEAAFASYISLQAVRGRRFRRKLEALSQRMAELLPEMDWGKLDQWEVDPRNPSGPPRRKVVELTDDEIDCLHYVARYGDHPMSRNEVIGEMLASALRMSAFYLLLSWDLLLATGEERFITSDEPVRTWRDPKGSPRSFVMPFPPTDDITFPVGPQQCLRLYLTPFELQGDGSRPLAVRRKVPVGDDTVAIVNGRTQIGAERWLLWQPGWWPSKMGVGHERLPIAPPVAA